MQDNKDVYLYIAIVEKGDVGGFVVSFPDFPNIVTEGDTFAEAQANAKEALELALYDMEERGEPFPTPSSVGEITQPDDSLTIGVEAWLDIVREEMRNKTVKKTLTIPKWLNDAAERHNVNFSQLLQHALKERLRRRG